MMNDKFMNIPNPDDESIARKLDQVAGQTQASDRFAAELESKLRSSHRPRAVWFNQVSPALRWVAVMALLALVLSWSIKTLVPKPQPAINGTPGIPAVTTGTPQPEVLPDASATPAAERVGFDFRGGKVFLEQPLPESPQKAHVYLLNKDEPATQEQARALADRFGIQGEVYSEPNYVFNSTNYVFSDGKQKLSVYSDRYFSYTADIAKVRTNPNGMQSENAEAKLHEFLQARGMDFPFEIQATDFFGGYSIRPLAPDSIPMQYESFTWPPMRVTFDENGEVLNIDATLLALDQNPVGEFDIISAQEAFDLVRNDNATGGKSEFMNSVDNRPQEWYRSYPDNQPVTIAGYLSSNPAVDPGKPPLLFIDGVSLTGNTSGMDSVMDYSFVKGTGKYFVENGIRKFQVESWDRNVNEAYVSGTLSQQGDRIVITSDDGGQQYPLIDPPADLPVGAQLPDSNLAVSGLILNNELSWTYIQYFENMMGGGGGGGGGGLGFYKLNLSGPPVPFPTPASQPDSNQGFAEYVVKEGDTLLAIAESFGLGRTPEVIFQANNLQSGDALIPGTVLMIPVQGMSQETGVYTVQEGDTVASIASNYGVSISELGKANHLNDQFVIYVGQQLVIPLTEVPEEKVEDLRGYLNISILDHGDGTSTKEYRLDVNMPDGGSSLYNLDGPNLDELDTYNALPILVTGTMTGGNLSVESYKIPYPDLRFQILRGTQKVEEVGGQNVVTFTTEDGKSYVEYAATNNFPKAQEVTGYQGDLIEQEVLIIPDENFGGLPVAHVYQSGMIQAGGPAMEVGANVIHTYTESNDPGGVAPGTDASNLIIDQVELAYYVPNPYYQAASDPNYEQRSHYIQPVWHFRGHYEDGSSLDFMIQALKQEFLLPEISPGLSPG